MNANEPVGHLYPEGEGVTVYDIKFAWKVTGTTEPIPLYTHPANLTDEEIEQIGKEYGIKSVYQFAYYEFAKAILRKANKK